jgi:NTP pyrophosphatase (non-canonical NTP hydrolase)
MFVEGYDISIPTIQAEVAVWSNRNFGGPDLYPVEIAALGMGEEAGELQRAILKRWHNIRGTHEEWTEEIKKELGDCFIKLCDVASRAGLGLEECIDQRWDTVKQREFGPGAIGYGLPTD